MKRRKWTYWLFVRIPAWYLLLSVVLVVLLRWVPVRYTPVMLKRAFQARNEHFYHSEREWVSLEDISPELVKAVIRTEDQRFYQHHGFDWEEMDGMWKRHKNDGSAVRGCSTISQQVAKNVFTFGTPTLARKVSEAYWTCLIELFWPKDRIMEVYLNVVELGHGVYGAEAAAERYFDCPARSLDRRQSVALAVSLPDPLEGNPLGPSPRQRRLRTAIMDSYK